MRLFLADLTEQYGGVRGYTAGLLGIDDDLVATLRNDLLEPACRPEPSFRRADETDLPELVRLRDEAALAARPPDRSVEARRPWRRALPRAPAGRRGLDRHTRPARSDRRGMGAVVGRSRRLGHPASDRRLRTPAETDRRTAPPGTGRRMLAEAEHRIATGGRTLCQLDCLAGNPRLREYSEGAGYTVVGGQPSKDGGLGNVYAVTLLEKRLT